MVQGFRVRGFHIFSKAVPSLLFNLGIWYDLDGGTDEVDRV